MKIKVIGMGDIQLYKMLLARIKVIDKQIKDLHNKENHIYKKLQFEDEKKRVIYYGKLDEMIEKRHELYKEKGKITKKLEELSNNPIEIIKGDKIDLVKVLGDLYTYRYSVFIKGSEKKVGYVEYRKNMGSPVNNKDWLADISYHIEKTHRGKGYATEALMLLTDKLYKDGIETIYISTYDSNIASKKIIEKLGGKLVEKYSDGNYLLYKCNLREIKEVKKM